jgi:8-amino-7-oxononanoate synthase
MAILDVHRHDLDGIARNNRLRSLTPRAGADFASNDYLGLASSPALIRAVAEALSRGVPVGSGGSRLLRGNHPEHEALEGEAARFFGSESTLYFSSGYGANTALFATLPQRGDLIVHDALIHASAHEGMRLSRADATQAKHNDPGHMENVITSWRAKGNTGRIWIAVESLYSMDGDRAPLMELAALAARHDAFLVIDEAHATGVFGAGGQGLASGMDGADNVIALRTCGKALGCEGALVCGPKIMRDMLVNRGRAFIFSTAPSPLMASAVRAALGLLTSEPERRARLMALSAYAADKLSPLGAISSGSQIIPLIIGDDGRTMAIASQLQAHGLDVRGIRPPTVPAGTARLRISITLNIDVAEIDALADALTGVL